MSSETWARVSLRITSERLAATEVAKLIGMESIAKPGASWAIDLTTDSGIGLEEQLTLAKHFLREKIMILEQISQDSDINISIGWTPRSPQDGILLDGELIGLMSRFGCYILLDTYLD